MARITTYTLDSNISLNDKLVGTDADDNSITKNYSIDALGNGLIELKNIITGAGTLNTIPVFTPDGQALGDSIITQPDTGIDEISISGRLSVTGDLVVDGRANFQNSLYVRIGGLLQDGNSLSGTAGQVLSSTGTGIEWVDPYIRSEKVIVSTAELRDLHNTPKILVDVTAGNPKEICQVYSVIFSVSNNNMTDNLIFPNDITIQSNNANPWKYIIPQATANDQFVPFYVPSLTAGSAGLDSDVVLSSAGAAVETGTATTTMTVWITYRIFELNA